MGSLNHPNIVTIHSIEELDGQRLITMELVEGDTLHNLVPETGLAVDRCLGLAIPLTAAVAAAHQRGVTHRDIKPANIMVTTDGLVKVVDFGLAKLRQSFDDEPEVRAAEPALTREGQVLGTVPYMAPEQFQGLPADHRSDVFALGVVLYEMMTGRHPFPGDTQPLVISSILRDPPRPVEPARADLPPGLRAVVSRCLEKIPTDRYQDAAALHRDLVALKQDLDSAAILRSAGAAGSTIPWRAAVAGMALVIAAVVGFWLLQRGTGGELDVGAKHAGVAAEAAAVEASIPTMAVMHFWNMARNQDLDWLRDGLPDMLITDLSQSSALRVIPADHMYGVLADLRALDIDRRPGADLAREVGKRTGAGLVVTGGFTRLGEHIRIDVHVHAASTGEVRESMSREGVGDDSIFSLVDDLSHALRRQFADRRVADDAVRDLRVEAVTTSSLDAYRLYVEGTKLHRQIKLAEAESLYKQAIELDPGFAMAYARLMAVNVTRGDLSRAKHFAELAFEHADRLPEVEKSYIEAEYFSAQRATYSRAITAFEATVERFPEHIAARRSLGHLYGILERFEDAIAQYQPVFEADAPISGIPNALLYMHAALDRFEAADEVWQRERQRHENEWVTDLMRGTLMTNWGRLDEALEAFDRAQALRPGEPLIDYARWRALILQGDRTAARSAAERLLTSDLPAMRFQGRLQLGMTALYAGDAAAARRSYGTARDESADLLRAVAFGRLAELELLAGAPQEALRLARRAQAEAADDWPGWEGIYLEALALQALGDAAAADLASARFTAKTPEADDLSIAERRYSHHLTAQLALARGDLETAHAAAARAEALLPPRGIHWDWVRYPDHAALWETQARLAEARGDERTALLYYRRLADSLIDRHEDPVRWVRSLYHCGRLLAAAGDEGRARRYYDSFVGAWGEGDVDRDLVRAARRALGG